MTFADGFFFGLGFIAAAASVAAVLTTVLAVVAAIVPDKWNSVP